MKVWPLLCGIAIVAGCAHFEPQPVAPAQTAAQFDARQLDDPSLEKFLAQNLGHESPSWPLENWDLNSLTLAAFYFHPDLEVARAQWRVAKAGALTAGARPNPSVSFSPGYDTQIPGNYSPWLIPLTFDVPIETAGKRGKRIAEAEKIAESARWNFVMAAWQIRSNVRDALFDFQMSGRRAALLQKQFAAQTEIVKLLQQRLDAGAIARPELTLAQIALNKSQLDLSAAQAKRDDAHARLAQALGVSLTALDDVKLADDFSAKVPDALTSAARAASRCAAARTFSARWRITRRRKPTCGCRSPGNIRTCISDLPTLGIPAMRATINGALASRWSCQFSTGTKARLPKPKRDENLPPRNSSRCKRRSSARSTALSPDWKRRGSNCRTGASVLAAAEAQQQSVAAQVQAGAAEQLDLSSAEIELNSVRLTQLDGEAQLQTAVGALEDALQSPADSLAAAIQRIASEN